MGCAAVATVIAQVISAVLCFVKLKQLRGIFDLRMQELRPRKQYIADIIRLGIPSGLTQAIFSCAMLLTQTLVPMEKWKRDALAQILTDWMAILEEALANRSGIQAVSPLARQLSRARTASELRQGLLTLKKAAEYTRSNVSPAAVCGWLLWELR